jgi:hypothetical protein
LRKFFANRIDVYIWKIAEVAPTIFGGAPFFAGWIARFGHSSFLLTFPLSERAHRPPSPTTTK